ncbi:ubiquitin carboxyl-terminal hydrolase 20 [Wyeomyia smithii]|uniref:ubiquitin carboxyl-terminal hydrolase 20 n=1 Tax=Wyeomyia smithii TaxID=174621 RepID=UPI002467AD0E|nr:ubiquitin carboxyl-terminal hydrolase 20 [Wyeomyia smithii]XP_055546764.1 ubiquitin carboxyl-terminal hydrolase 20 [Wyeomyia smithii]XP_055546765.1 ubiquitin carboxyl-terminal hydrolase 20 [Wyeomyia smithii]XP_055546766.1 ubiquitin carboxyl-terminal hydrolase 20 [Wyeomyia smithii]XP_055546767.1 ubiquitin carboxyl-terminal hydrolase 20 [Wyeomyia smithii]XP_055546768.1 ubiquitin carboxyl-terminal hydrolase 20 [Wyeomyia smithii]
MARCGSNKCPHLENVVQLSLLELCKLKKGEPCTECEANGPNLWICLQKNCLHIGCSEQYNDHSTTHFQTYRSHCIHMNLSSQRIWCYLCEFEVFLAQHQQHHQQIRRTSMVSNDSSDTSRYSANNEKLLMYGDRFAGGGGGESCDSSCEEDEFERHGKWNGLVGLQNIANTCYMNAAIQALSNSPPLTGFFLDCGSILETDLLGNQTVSKPGLAKHYHKLIKDMWCKNRRYIVPSGILYGIRIVHPMFRGYQQHDTQEFLRCFMDQLHEELKEIAQPPPELLPLQGGRTARGIANNQSPCSSPSPSQSEAEYETCDSGVSEQSSLSDEVSVNSKRTRRLSRSPSPNAGQRNMSSNSRQQSPIGSNRSTSSSTGSMTSPHTQHQPGNPGDQQQPKAAKDKLPERSIISDIFDGKLLSSVQCLTCDRISTREETFQDLSLPIPGKDHLAVLHQNHSGMPTTTHAAPVVSSGSAGNASGNSSNGITCSDAVYPVTGDSWIWWIWNWPIWSWVRSWFWGPAVSLHDCMAAFFSADELKGDNMYSCEKCNKLRNGVKFSRVLALPEMLCVHLKRFRHDLSYSSKISSPVHFPLHGLDMRPYLHKDCKSDVTSYDLCAVICHHGTVGGGHYTSFAKHDPTGKWFEFDDQLVTQVNPDDVQNCEAYVLFYRKNNAKMTTIRAQASDLINVQEHASDIRFYISRNWLHRFNTFAEPGPIDNWTLLCPHGAFPPNKAPFFSKLVVPIPQALWDFLYQKFGGGPVCNHIFPCHTCKKAAESLSRRQRAELEAFTTCNDEYQYNENPTPIYAISMAWFRQWQLFARGVTTDEPGPVDNKSIAVPTETSIPLRSVRQGSDYAQINSTLWHFFHGIYGGGPEIVLRGQPVPPPEAKPTKCVKERDSEPMDIGEPLQPPLKPSTTSNGARDVTSEAPAEVPPKNINQTVSQKPQKSVSFEDNESYMDNGTGHNESLRSVQMKRKQIKQQQKEQQQSKEPKRTETEGVDGLVTFLRRKQLKHQQQITQDPSNEKHHSDTLDIRGKKDKRHRTGMKASGLFGAEGKYQPANSDNFSSNISRLETSNESSNTQANCSYLSSAVTASVAFSKSADDGHTGYHHNSANNTSESNCSMTIPSRSVDEIMPLLTHASISQAPVAEDEDGERDDSDGDGEASIASKERSQHAHHRKGHHGNKNGGHHSTESSMMSFGRKKIKSKYLKSKQTKAAGTVDSTDHYAITVVNGTQTSDSEK